MEVGQEKSGPKEESVRHQGILRGSDGNGDNAGISMVLERCPPRRISQNQKTTFVEEFMVRWDPEDCFLQEAKIHQAQGFVITSITSLDEGVPTPLLKAATAAKRPRDRPKVTGHPPPDTRCRV